MIQRPYGSVLSAMFHLPFRQTNDGLTRMQPSCEVRVVSGCSSHARCSKGGQACIIEQ
ncbi:hypothetical protein BDQ94DRAFT_149062 [Aspergillus welwitschiae]|uniref:Uncharacterized protein n=1 Tax=Aspergillus welwitschiae TaxID=1341132 RepID=A0A3F3PU06_9EURO|nr:hypothetical protein BDQ94DRAFT_149062 [Aspergillus welwitschiae]RDH30441.1 hypothetical protein BDQ94DRAFT_149062 [Aspergillus welwitschiae]